MYTQSQLTGEIRNELGVIVPQDDSTQEWQSFHQWKINGGTLNYVNSFEGESEQYERNFLPKVVSQRQLRTQLVLDSFDLNDIQTAINELTEPNKSIAQIAWDYAITFERDSSLLMCLATNLGLTQNEVDTIFLNASKL